MDLVRLDPDRLDDATAATWCDLRTALALEELPQDEPPPLEQLVAELATPAADKEVQVWVGLEDGRAVAVADVELRRHDNLHMVFADAGVHPAERRRGLGRRLLRHVAEVAAADGRAKVCTWCPEGTAGQSFLELHGGSMVYLARKSRLQVADLDRGLLEGWAAAADGYRVATWDAPTPPERLQAYADVLGVMNTAPLQDADLEDEAFTPDIVAGWEGQILARRGAKHVAVVEHEATGQVVGLTELVYDGFRRGRAFQWNTGVDAAHRGHGLGRTLKAVNALRMLDERPDARSVDTFNNDGNAPMLAINDAMGFRPLIRYTQYELPVEALLER